MARRDPTHCCPRCGYDLSGTVESWSGQCPVEGVCSECGLEYGWRSILNADFRVDPLFCETAISRLPRAMITTAWRALRPWSFWRWVRMEYRFRPQRMALSLALWFVTAWAAQFAVFFTASWMLGAIWMSRAYGTNRSIVQFAAYPQLFEYRGGPYTENYTPLIVVAAWMMLTGVMYTILGTTLAQARAGLLHVVRITGYQYVVLALVWTTTQYVLNAELWRDLLKYFNASAFSVSQTQMQALDWSRPAVVLGTMLAVPVWLTLYWGFACSRYLRIRRPWLVAIVMLLTSGLAVGTALAYYILAPGWFL